MDIPKILALLKDPKLVEELVEERERIKELAKATVHAQLGLEKARGYSRGISNKLARSTEGTKKREDFVRFLSNLSFFLKAKNKGGKMEEFQIAGENKPTNEEITNEALELAGRLKKRESEININKLKRLGARIAASRDRHQALVHLARFYTLKGVPQDEINGLVKRLGELDLDAFKKLFAWGLTFYEAKTKGWEG